MVGMVRFEKETRERACPANRPSGELWRLHAGHEIVEAAKHAPPALDTHLVLLMPDLEHARPA
eukprot:1152120-Pelagomonas_calceolata.AAC.4